MLKSALVVALSVGVAAPELPGSVTMNLNPNFGGVDEELDCAVEQTGHADRQLRRRWPLLTGKLDGTNVTLRVPTGANNEVTVTFIGTLNPAGTIINGMWHLPQPAGERTGKFALTKR